MRTKFKKYSRLAVGLALALLIICACNIGGGGGWENPYPTLTADAMTNRAWGDGIGNDLATESSSFATFVAEIIVTVTPGGDQ